ncbi:MAG: SO_0444 family Cu/Zn efflux transporter [Planctomycetota bacterium]
MTGVVDFVREVAVLTCDTAPFLLVGFLIAGLIKVYVPQRLIYGHLGGNDLRSVVRASLYGIPLPLCSCSVIPTATSLKKNGASKGATASFLISTPETGVDSISVTYALLDPIMTVVRPVVAFVTAVLTGSVVALFVRRGWDQPTTGEVADVAQGYAHDHDHDHDHEHADPAGGRLRQALRYGFGTLLDDLTPWLVLGFAVSALISLWTPDDLFVETVPAGWPAMLLMLVVATPVYICATASTPIAAALIAKGMDPGAALVFLLVGPATNVTTLLVVGKLLGRRTLWIYLASITGVALAAGWLVGQTYQLFRWDLAATVTDTLASPPGPLAVAAGVLFAGLLVQSAVRIDLWRGPRRRVAATAGLLLYASTCLTLVGPGQRGWIVRFGGVERALEQPGLYWHWPYPIDRPELVRPAQVRSLTLGYEPPALRQRWTPAATQRKLDDEAEVMTGDGTLLRVAYTVHYRWRDVYRVRFGLDDPAALTAAFAEAALRQVVAAQLSDTLLIDERAGLAQRAAARLQRELDDIDSGIAVQSVNVRSVHAPPEVHFEYRDVASALEDRERLLHEAQRDRADTAAAAQAEAYREEQQATAAKDASVQQARGDAARFVLQRAAFHEYPATAASRLRFEGLEQTLGRGNAFVLLGDHARVELLDFGERAAADPSAPIRSAPTADPAVRILQEFMRDNK